MSGSTTPKQGQTSKIFSDTGTPPTATGNNTGSNRSRRSSWSDSKVKKKLNNRKTSSKID